MKNSEKAIKRLNKIYSCNEIGVLAEDLEKMFIEIDDHMAEIAEAGFKFKVLTKEVMEALAAAIDAKDKYTNGHSKRVAEYSRKIAEIAGKFPEECEMIYYAGLLHDVGGNTNKRQYDSILPHYELSDSTSCMSLYVFLLFSSSNGQPDGGNYHEYLFLKLNGEKRETSKSFENQVSVILTDSFKGWKTWMKQNKQGLDCTVNIRREGSRIIMQTENAGVILNSVTTLPDDAKDVYLALTGDQCAISGIRIKR